MVMILQWEISGNHFQAVTYDKERHKCYSDLFQAMTKTRNDILSKNGYRKLDADPYDTRKTSNAATRELKAIRRAVASARNAAHRTMTVDAEMNVSDGDTDGDALESLESVHITLEDTESTSWEKHLSGEEQLLCDSTEEKQPPGDVSTSLQQPEAGRKRLQQGDYILDTQGQEADDKAGMVTARGPRADSLTGGSWKDNPSTPKQ